MEKAAYRQQKVNSNCDNLFLEKPFIIVRNKTVNEPKRLRGKRGTDLLQALQHLGHVGFLALVGLEGEIHRDAVQRYFGHVSRQVPARKRRPAVYPAARAGRGLHRRCHVERPTGIGAGSFPRRNTERPGFRLVRRDGTFPADPQGSPGRGLRGTRDPGRGLRGTRGAARRPRTSRQVWCDPTRFPGPPPAAPARLPGTPGPWRRLPWQHGQRSGDSRPSPPVRNPRARITCCLLPSRAVRNFRRKLSRELRRCLGNGAGRWLPVGPAVAVGPGPGPFPPGWRGRERGWGGSGAVSCELLWRPEGPRAGGDQVRWGLGPAGPGGKRDPGLRRVPPPLPDTGCSAGGSPRRFPSCVRGGGRGLAPKRQKIGYLVAKSGKAAAFLKLLSPARFPWGM